MGVHLGQVGVHKDRTLQQPDCLPEYPPPTNKEYYTKSDLSSYETHQDRLLPKSASSPSPIDQVLY